jgi:hypothetical protein
MPEDEKFYNCYSVNKNNYLQIPYISNNGLRTTQPFKDWIYFNNIKLFLIFYFNIKNMFVPRWKHIMYPL